MLRKAWYAVCPSSEVAADPKKVTVNGRDYVLYRDKTGRIVACNGYCPHRGCDLSMGSIHEGELVCPFHGWHFEGTGSCTHIPANKLGTPIPPSYRLNTYPVTELAELVWLYTHPNLDAPAPTSFATFADLLHDDWQYVSFEQTWQAHFTRAVESVLDVSHLPFVHPETTGTDVDPTVIGPEYTVKGKRIVIYPTPFAPSHPMEPVHPTQDAHLRTEIELLFPNQWIIRTPFGNDGIMCTFLTFTPVHDDVTSIFGIAMRNFDLDAPWMDAFHIDHTLRVMAQDQRIVESLRPRIAPFQLQDERHVPSDVPAIRFRVMLRNALKEEQGGF
ncbi:aromatic ring-hydroxylating oxygenase subunit alpha [Alicyclobacillus fastidiosus]|uniref:aromatic ring-hydroxylating oxygenase subunit alpha n=1 Tax=Alicyclobacillus fastidiosus TaxID=392011 RepID=UPI0023B82F81|nr:aromatic ring-hydroxylating dioxygenase subunit alpha [Alicyclobacillus fastidiosus]WEH09151.1 aromatic ring-hydroxylating dioxygenase subunit alpha [Alicyclobacillus fastidiosus]